MFHFEGMDYPSRNGLMLTEVLYKTQVDFVCLETLKSL